MAKSKKTSNRKKLVATKPEPRRCGCDAELIVVFPGTVCSSKGRDCPELPQDLRDKLLPLTPEQMQRMPHRAAARARNYGWSDERERRFAEHQQPEA